MKSILLHVNDDDGQEGRLVAAIAVARQQHGRLSCVQSTPVSDYVATDPFGGVHAVTMLFEHFAEQALETRTKVEASLAKEGVEYDWSIDENGTAVAIVNRSRFADLIVLSLADQRRSKSAGQLPLIADVCIHSRTPVLAIPSASRAFDPAGVAMIAWNGSPESAHAVRAALPLLRSASAVQVISLDEDQDFPMANVRNYLAAHGITAGCHEHQLNGKSVGERLCHISTELSAAYVVMGAYGHSRFREAVLGGVSRHMLAHSPIALLLAH